MKRFRTHHPHAIINNSINRTYDGEEQKSGGDVSWVVGILLYDYGENSLRAIKKDRNVLYVLEKVQRSSASLFQLFCALHATVVSLGSNAVKLQA